MKLKKTQLLYLVIKLTKPLVYQRLVRDEKLREVLVSYFFVLIITLILPRIFSEALMSISNKHNYKNFNKKVLAPASLLHYTENILNQPSRKCRDCVTMTALSFTKSTGLSTIFVHKYIISLGTTELLARQKDDTDTSFSFSSHTSLWYSKTLRLLDN